MNGILDLKHPVGCCVFSFFVSFADFFELHAKYGQKLENFVKSWIFCLIWHETQKFAKMRKCNI